MGRGDVGPLKDVFVTVGTNHGKFKIQDDQLISIGENKELQGDVKNKYLKEIKEMLKN
jgi:hypothetical protein